MARRPPITMMRLSFASPDVPKYSNPAPCRVSCVPPPAEPTGVIEVIWTMCSKVKSLSKRPSGTSDAASAGHRKLAETWRTAGAKFGTTHVTVAGPVTVTDVHA